MKVTKYLPILAVCLMTTGCNSKKEAVLTSGIDLANLDGAVSKLRHIPFFF